MDCHPWWALAASVLLVVSLAWGSEERATPDDARAMALRAAERIDQAGPATAFREIMREPGAFQDRELFVVVMDRTGTVLAHGERPQYIGTNMAALRDVHGVPFVARMLAMPNDGLLDYSWQNPLTKVVERKRSYVVHRPDYVLFVGAYFAAE